MSLLPCVSYTHADDGKSFFIRLQSIISNNAKITMFSSLPKVSNSTEFYEPAVSSYLIEPTAKSDRWFCATCDIFVENINPNHFSEFDSKHARLFYAHCDTVGLFKHAKVGEVCFDEASPYSSISEFCSVFRNYQIDDIPFARGSFSDVFHGIFLQSSQHVAIKIFNEHSTVNTIYEEFLLLKSFRYILKIYLFDFVKF